MTGGFGEIGERLRRSTVQISGAGRGSGSGVIWSDNGTVITNAHVANQEGAQVQLWDGRSFPARVVKRNTRRDLTALRIDTAGLPAAEAGNSRAVRPGELAIAVGNPLGFTGALTTGTVYSVGRIRELGVFEWVQATIRLAPGNSGGPLANARGEVIGINTMITNGGIALAIPTHTVVSFLASDAAARPLGITGKPVRLETGAVGLLLLAVDPRGPAARASLMLGDILVALDGRPFQTVADFQAELENPPAVMVLQFRRGGLKNTRAVAIHFGDQSIAA